MAVNPAAIGVKPQFELADGTPAVGNKLFMYVAGSVNTKQNSYSDSTGGSANTNPIVLNSLGMPPNEIWFTAGLSYKVVYAPSTDTDPPTSPIWTIDNLTGINDITAAVTEWIAGPTPTFISATSFSLVGDQTSTFQVGRRIRTTNTGGTVYSTIVGSAFGAVTTVTVVNDSSVLDSGLSAVSYGLLSKTGNSLPRGIFPTMANVSKAIYGLTYANNGADATNDIDIAAGGCIDSTGVDTITVAAITKQSDVAWAVGNAAGGLDTGAVGNSDYYIWAIKRVDTSVADILFSLSSTAPTMPANYTLKRLIGWFKRVGGTIVAFTTLETEGGGLDMRWNVPTLEVNVSNALTTSRRTDAMKVPLNFSTIAHLIVMGTDAVSGFFAWIGCPDVTDAAPGTGAGIVANITLNGVGTVSGEYHIKTSAAGLVASRASIATVDGYTISTLGFSWGRRN